MKKKIHYLLAAIAMLVSQILPISNVFATQPPTPDYAIISIGNSISVTDVSNATSATATYANGTLTVSGTGLYADGTTVYSPAGNNVTLSVTPNASYAGDIRVNGTLEGATSVTLPNLAANSVNNVEAEFSQATTQATIRYAYTSENGQGAADIFINDQMFDASQATPGAGNNEDAGTFDGSIEYIPVAGKQTIKITTFATMAKLSSITINGTPCAIPADNDLINHIDGQMLVYGCQVDDAPLYEIATTSTAVNIVGSFLWSYKDVDKGNDDYLDHGHIEFVKAVLPNGGGTITTIDPAAMGSVQWNEKTDQEGRFGGAMFPVGTELTVKLLPEEGYQLVSFGVNGGAFTAQDTPMVYTFTVGGGNFHLYANFSKVNNAVKADDADAVTSGSITLGNGELDNGTARLEVKDAEGLEPADIKNFEGNAEGYNLKTVLDIKLFNTIYKATANATWDTQLDELNHEATITLKLDEGVDGNDIIIVHEKHDGTYEVIPTVYDPTNHTVTFKTSSFSNYAIATRTIASPNTGYMTSEGGSVVEDNTAIAIIGTLSLWGLLAFVVKKGLV